jgi:5'-nucleotidase
VLAVHSDHHCPQCSGPRAITTLKSRGVEANETFFLGGMDKRRILTVLKPHLFFDDQLSHLKGERLAMVQVPFGVANVDAEG